MGVWRHLLKDVVIGTRHFFFCAGDDVKHGRGKGCVEMKRWAKRNNLGIATLGFVVLSVTVLAAARKTYYCKYCGLGYQTINSLTAADCVRHPAGRHKHELYQGTEKATYECQYCGHKAMDIRTLTAAKCFRHPKGAYKGRHVPAL